MAVTTRLERITPTKANRYLESAGKNRPLSKQYAQSLADAMLAGEFEVNGETLKFDVHNDMIDGQHRCYACVLAGVPFQSFVTRGLNTCTFDTIDTGHKRSVGHVFAKNGEANYALLAGAVSWLWKYTHGFVASGSQRTPRHKQALKMLAEHADIRNSLIWGQRVRSLTSPSLMTCMHYLFSLKDSEKANEFFEYLATGENLSSGSSVTSAILLLRKRLLEDRMSKTRLLPREVVKLVIKAWNAFYHRKVTKTLRHRTVGDAREPFPEIEG